MKYINSDKLKTEIENIYSESVCEYNSHKSRYSEGVLDVIHRISSIITSLQQEQPDAIGGVVHHALGTHWVITNQEQLCARLKQFPEGAEVEILIEAKKEE